MTKMHVAKQRRKLRPKQGEGEKTNERGLRSKERGHTFRNGDSANRTFLGDICEESKRINFRVSLFRDISYSTATSPEGASAAAARLPR